MTKLWLLVLTGLWCFSASSANASPSLSLGVGQGLAGQTITIPVTLKNNDTVASALFDIQYDASQLTAGTPLAGAVLTSTGHGISSSQITADTLRIVITPPADNTAIATGTVVEIPFTVAAGANSNSKTLTLTNLTFHYDQALLAPADKLINGLIVTDLNGDTDGDGMSDGWEYANGLDATDVADGLVDSDGDGISNVDEYLADTNPWSGEVVADSDGDGVPDVQDAFPFDVAEWLDSDGDGVGNNTDLDDDNDGMLDSWELTYGLNPTDATDAALDDDADGLSNLQEYQHSTDPALWDTDADGMADGWEIEYGLNPLYAEDASADIDGDGLTNLDEYQLGSDPAIQSGVEAVVWVDLVAATASANTLTSTNSDWNSGAASQQTFAADGALEFTAAATNAFVMSGLSNSNAGASYEGIAYAVLLMSDGSLDIYENGVGRGVVASYQIGDIFRVERTGTTIEYKQNDVVIYTSTVPSSGDLMADVSILSMDGQVADAMLFGVMQDDDSDLMDDVWEFINGLDPTDATDAALDGDVDGLSNVQEYQNNTDFNNWDSDSDGMADGWEVQYGLNPLDSLDASADIDGDGLTNLDEYQLGSDPTAQAGAESVVWVDLVAATASANTLTSTNSDWNSGAASQQSFAADGALEFTVTATNAYVMSGLSNSNVGASYEGIAYGILLMSGGSLDIYENGVGRGVVASYQAGDIFRVERTGTTIEYKQNDVVIYTSTVPSSGDLMADVSILTMDGQVADAMLFGVMQDDDSDLMDDVWEIANGLNPTDATDASLDGDADGLTNLQEYLNSTNPGDWDSDADGMDDGWEVQYGLDPLDSSDASADNNNDGLTNLEEYQQGNDPTAQSGAEAVVWVDLVGVSVSANTLTSTLTGWESGAASQQTFAADGALEFKAAATNAYVMPGLSNSNAGASYQTIAYGILLMSDGNLDIYENGVGRGVAASYQTGDIFRVERTGTTIEYKQNDVVFYTSTVPSSGDLMADVSIYTMDGQIVDAMIFEGQ